MGWRSLPNGVSARPIRAYISLRIIVRMRNAVVWCGRLPAGSDVAARWPVCGFASQAGGVIELGGGSGGVRGWGVRRFARLDPGLLSILDLVG